MNWIQILETIAAAVPAIETVEADVAALIVTIAHAASTAPVANQAAIATAAAKLRKTA